jgi:isoleucyl-tRNA synthetase
VSRNRFWSVPLPIWECAKCQERVCVGSARELETLTGQSVPDLHRPYVDKLQWQCKKCSGTMQRVPEVLDVWFDAGSMPYATKATFPADFIVESIEQTRLWFYVLHVLATALQEQAAFKNAIASGIIFAADGAKLSKKLKNYADPEETITRFGADALRLYLLTSSSLGEPYYFSEPDLQKMQRTSYLTLWNVYSFFVRYANVQQWQPSSSPDREALEEVLDHWILARVQQLENEVTGTLDNYQVDAAARALIPFIDDLSNWYVRRSRSRFQHAADPALREAAFATLYEVLVRTSKVVAPFMPFVADALYRNLTGKDSVHLELWPEREELTGDQQKLLEEMQRVRKSISEGLALRAEAKIKVRQPLATITLAGEPIAEEFMAMIKDELNVKEVTFGSVTELDTALTSELEQEGIAREIIRQGQSLRREANYALNDRIKLIVAGAEGDIAEALTTHRQLILDTLQADDLLSEGKADAEADIAIAGQKLHLGVTKT